MPPSYHHLVEAAERLKRHGQPLIEDPARAAEAREDLGRPRGPALHALRVLTALEKGEHPGAGGSLTKLSYSEFEKRFMELAQEILGPYGQLTEGVRRS